MKLENSALGNVGGGKLLKKYSEEVVDLLGLKNNTNINEHTQNAMRVAIERILEGNLASAKSILSMKLSAYKRDPKQQIYASELENLIDELIKNTSDYKESYDKEALQLKESKADNDKIAAQRAKEEEDRKKIEKEKQEKERRNQEKIEKLKLAADLKRKEEEEKSAIVSLNGGKINTAEAPENNGIPVFITRQLRQDLVDLGVSRSEISNLKPEDAWKLLRQKQEEKESKKNIEPLVPPTTEVGKKIEEIKFKDKETIESEVVLKRLNRILKTNQTKFTITKVFTEKGKDGSTRESLKIKGEDGKTKQITSELLKKIIQEAKEPSKKNTRSLKPRTKNTDTTTETPDADTISPDADQAVEVDPVVEIEQEAPVIETENIDPVKIEVDSKLENAKLVGKLNEALGSTEKNYTITQIWTASDKKEYVMLRGGSSKRIRKVSLEILNTIINEEGIGVVSPKISSPAQQNPDDTTGLDTTVDTTINIDENTMAKKIDSFGAVEDPRANENLKKPNPKKFQEDPRAPKVAAKKGHEKWPEDPRAPKIDGKSKVIEAVGGFHADAEAAKEVKIEAVKNDIVEKLKLEANKQSPLWEKNLAGSGLTRADLEKVPGFVKLSTGEQLLVLEEINQRNVTKMQALTRERLAKEQMASKNILGKLFSKINFGDSKAGKTAQRITGAIGGITIKNIWHSMTKNYRQSKAEKLSAREIMDGADKISIEEIAQISERIKSLGLSVNEKTGEITFLKFPVPGMENNQASKEASEYNKIANAFMNIPNSWQGKNTATSAEFKKFEKMRDDYEKSKENLLKSLEKAGLAQGLEPRDARVNAMKVLNEADKGFKYLSYSRKNPEAASILESKANQTKLKLFMDLVKDSGTFVGSGVIGAGLRGIAGVAGGGIFGGIRGWLRGKKEVRSRYETDQVSTTRLEAKEGGKGQGEKIDRFINADDQVRKITALVDKITGKQKDGTFKEVSKAEKLRNAERLKSRLEYISKKEYNGLLNRGSKDDIALNYRLNEALASASAVMIEYTNGIGLAQGIEANYDEKRYIRLLDHINKTQDKKYEEERKMIVTNAAVQGAVIGVGGAILGSWLRDNVHVGDWLRGGEGGNGGGTPISKTGGNPWDQELPPAPTPTVEESVKPLSITIDPKHGGIHMIHQFKEALKIDLKDHMDQASAAERHLLETSDQDLAREFGLYNPKTAHQIELGDNNESAMIHRGATLSRDTHGDIVFHDGATGESDRFISAQNGTVGPVYKDYQGDMFHSKVGDTSNIKTGSSTYEGGSRAPDPTEGTKLDEVPGSKTATTPDNGTAKTTPSTADQSSGSKLDEVPTNKASDKITPPKITTESSNLNSISKIHEIQNNQLSQLKTELGKGDYDKLIERLNKDGVKYESDEKTLRTISVGEHVDYNAADRYADSGAMAQIASQTGFNKVALSDRVITKEITYKLDDGSYRIVKVQEVNIENVKNADELIKPNVAPNADQATPTGSTTNPSEQLKASGGTKATEQLEQNPVVESFHAGHVFAEKAFPLNQNVQGIPRSQFDAMAQKNVLEDLGISSASKLLDTPENAYRVWMYESFGKLEQNSTGELVLGRLNMRLWGGDLDYVKSFMVDNPNNHITVALKDLEQRVYSASGRVVVPDGITVEAYAKRLIAELYK